VPFGSDEDIPTNTHLAKHTAPHASQQRQVGLDDLRISAGIHATKKGTAIQQLQPYCYFSPEVPTSFFATAKRFSSLSLALTQQP
ncbi:MAG: hypothetical protein ACRBBM_08050, partial [Pseudomonadaceae bacterium]